MKLLNEEVVINNMQILRFLNEKGIKDLSILSNLDIDVCIDLISFSNPKLSREILENQVNKDISFVAEIFKIVGDSLGSESEKKLTPKKGRRS